MTWTRTLCHRIIETVTTIDPVIGERYAYRASRTEPLVEVEVVKVGTQKPLRVYWHVPHNSVRVVLGS